MGRKAQMINIDWSIGLGLLILTLGTATLMIADFQPFDPERALENKASELQESLEEESSLEGYRTDLVSRSPHSISNIPVDRNYSFESNAYPGSGYLETGGEIRIEENRIITVQDAGNHTKRMVYFRENVSNISYADDVETGSWMNNSQISVKPESPGLQSLQISGRELLNSSADLSGTDFSVTDEDFYASSLKEDLKLYNNSRELIVENADSTFDLKNLSTLYWDADGSTTDLSGTGTFKDGETKGFSIADSDLGITFVGEMNATVSKPGNETVRAQVEADRLRVRLHESGYSAGKERIESFKDGYTVLSARRQISGPNREKLGDLDNLSDQEFEDNLSLEDDSYNITVEDQDTGETLLERGYSIPLRAAVTSNLGVAGLNRTGGFETFKSRVTVWR